MCRVYALCGGSWSNHIQSAQWINYFDQIHRYNFYRSFRIDIPRIIFSQLIIWIFIFVVCDRHLVMRVEFMFAAYVWAPAAAKRKSKTRSVTRTKKFNGKKVLEMMLRSNRSHHISNIWFGCRRRKFAARTRDYFDVARTGQPAAHFSSSIAYRPNCSRQTRAPPILIGWGTIEFVGGPAFIVTKLSRSVSYQNVDVGQDNQEMLRAQRGRRQRERERKKR